MRLPIRVITILALCVMLPAHAHTIRPAVATVTVDTGVVSVQIRLNAEAILAEIGPEHADTNDSPNAPVYDELRQLPHAQLAERFEEYAPQLIALKPLLVDGNPVSLGFVGIEVPPVGDIELARDSTVYLSADLPAESEQLVWQWPARYGSSVIRYRLGEAEMVSEWLQTGNVSAPFPLQGDLQAASKIAIGWNYLVIGFEHIVPKGLDHILFVIGIFLLSAALKPLLLQVTAFTVAHTITLGLSIYGVISAPSSVVEPLIALSIAYVGIENCLTAKLHGWRIALVFLFGLLHGMGFAGVLGEIGLPESEFLTALITFNVGVEFGQLAVIALCFLAVGWFRNESWYRSRVVIPVSVVISAVGLYWTWERVFS